MDFVNQKNAARKLGIPLDILAYAIKQGHVQPPTHSHPDAARKHYLITELPAILAQWHTWRASMIPPELEEGQSLCTHCSIRIAVPGHRMCTQCQAHVKKHYRLRKEAGKCLSCGGNAIKGKTKCDICAKRDVQNAIRWADSQHKQGNCVRCGQPAVTKWFCEHHRVMDNLRQRNRRKFLKENSKN